ncbi:retrovirus-related pol polyprotein from transposon TNT 1-94 [Tanacetum coccineum]
MILEFVENGPLIWPTIEENKVTRPRKYSELIPADAIQADYDIKAMNIILQGLPNLEQFQLNTKFLNTLPPEWSKFVTDVKLVKDLNTTNIDQLHAYLEQHEFHTDEICLLHERNLDQLALSPQYGSPYQSQQYPINISAIPLSITYPSNDYQSSIHHNVYSPSSSILQLKYAPTINQQQQPGFFLLDSGLVVLVFQKSDDPIDAINHMILDCCLQGRQTTFAVGTTRTYTPGASGSNSRKQQTVISQVNGEILHEKELAFLADLGILETQATQTVISHNASYQADDLDAYDYDYDELDIAKVALMENLSHYGLDALVEVVVQNSNSSAQQDALILSVIEQLKTQVVNCIKINLDNKSVNDTLTAKLERYKEQVKVLKEGQNVFSDAHEQNAEIDHLKHTLSEQLREKESLIKTISVLKDDFKRKKYRNIDREIALEKKIQHLHNIIYKRDQSAQTVHMLTKHEFFYDRSTKQAIVSKSLNTILLALRRLLKKEPMSQLLLRLVEQHRLESKTFEVKMNQVLHENERLLEQVINQDIVNIVVNSFVDNASVNVHECNKYLKLETELLNKKDFIEKETYDKLFINNSVSNQSAPNFDQYFELNELKAQSQEKDTVITKLKERTKSLSGNVNVDKVKMDMDKIKTRVKTSLKNDLRKLKGKALVDDAVTKHTIDPKMLKINVEPITPKLLNKRTAHSAYIKHTQEEAAVLKDLFKHVKENYPLDPKLEFAFRYTKLIQELLINISKACLSINNFGEKSMSVTTKNKDKRVRFTEPVTSSGSTNTKIDLSSNLVSNKLVLSSTVVVQIVQWYSNSGCSKHMTEDRSQLTNFVSKFLGTIKFCNNHVAKIMGYRDHQIENVTISRVYYVEGLGHNLFLVEQFCDSNHEVAFRQHTCFIRNLEGVDLLTGSRGNNLYTPSLRDMMASSPICLLSKALKTKSWLWHRRLSHLNFGVINHLARHVLVRGLPKLKFEKDHLCFACIMGKTKKKTHKTKSEDTNQEKLYLLHMDLCGPMCVASVNGKKYILVIVDDYSIFTWVKCLRSKNEAPDFIIEFLKMIQLLLKAPVRRIRTDNGIEFVNQTLRKYYEQVGISHETSVSRSSQ